MKAKTRRILFSLLLVLILAVIAAVMMVIGRGHTVYFDNKTLEDYQGQTYKSFEKVVVTVKGEEVAKLAKRERGMSIWIGQNFKMILEVTREKGGERVCRRRRGSPSLSPPRRRPPQRRSPARAASSTWVWTASWAWKTAWATFEPRSIGKQ